MTNQETEELCQKYFDKDGYTHHGDFDRRVDDDSLRVIYSFVREYKPVSSLQIGCWEGGTTSPILAALIKNKKLFKFVASELLDDKREKTRIHCLQKNEQEPIMIGDITKNLKSVPKEIDFLFHDSDHDALTTKWVIENIFPRFKKGALLIFHDWAVVDKDNVWIPKDGCWDETKILCELHNQGALPFEKVYWNYTNPGSWETGVFTWQG